MSNSNERCERRRALETLAILVAVLLARSPVFGWPQCEIRFSPLLDGAVENESGDWELEGEKDGVRSFLKQRTGSGIVEVAAEGIVSASSSRVATVVWDPDDVAHEFIPYLKQTETISTPDDGVRLVFQQVQAPRALRWIVRDRIFTNRVSHRCSRSEEGYFRFDWALDTRFRYDEGVYNGFVPLRENVGYWEILPIDESNALLRFVLFVDPGGSLPNWIINRGNQRMLPRLFAAIRERVGDAYYDQFDGNPVVPSDR